jgi:hypothetical protein
MSDGDTVEGSEGNARMLANWNSHWKIHTF